MTYTDDVPTGVVWEEPTPGRALVHVPRPDDEDKKSLLAAANARLKRQVGLWHTYATLAWARRWQTAEAYVQDPQLYGEMVAEATDHLLRQRAAVAKRLEKAKTRNDQPQINLLTGQLKTLDQRAPSALTMEMLTLKARGGRLARQAAVPAAVAAGPVGALVMQGMWWPLLAWPAAWMWLAVQGHGIAVAEGTVTVTPAEPASSEPTRVMTRPNTAPAPARAAAPPAPTVVLDGATAQEQQVLTHLADWDRRAAGRGLTGVLPDQPTLDDLGIRVVLVTTGRITPADLMNRLPALRAALDIPAETRTVLSPGASGESAVLRIRTRTPDLDVRWHPGRRGVGFVPETGRTVELDGYGHRLVAGVTGAGKSVAMRPWMARAVLDPLAALVFVDPKGQESPLWERAARTVRGVGPRGQEEMYAVICEVAAELEWRQETAGDTDWTPTPEHPELLLVIDEGAALMRMSKDKAYRDVLAKIEYLVTQGRAGRVWVHWATQYPTKGDGVPAQVSENITARMCLAVDGPQADRVMFGEQATSTGWTPSELEMPGWAMVRTRPGDAPEHVACWHMDDDQVRALPARAPWRSRQTVPQQEGGGDLPEVLTQALLMLPEGGAGVTAQQVADRCDSDVLDVQIAMRDAGVSAGRFTNGDGRQVRGYPRQVLEKAAARYDG